MDDDTRSRQELLAELAELRQRFAGLDEVDEARRRVEEQLRYEKELSEGLINSSPNGILAMDLEWRYTIWNPAMERISGFSREHCLGKVAFEVFPFLEELGLTATMEEARQGRSVVARNQLYVEPGSGREVYFDAYYSPLTGPGGDTVGVLGTVIDVNERKRHFEALREAHDQLEARVAERTAALTQQIAEREQAERELRRETEFTENLIRSSVDCILAYDHDFRYTLWNPAMEKLTSVDKEEALGGNMFELFPFLLETGADVPMRAALNGETVTVRDSPYKTPKTGAEGFFEAHYSPMYDTAGEIVGALGIVRDVTERKQLEEERIRASKLGSLGLLAGGLAHDFNNLLTGIMAYLSICTRLVEPESKIRQRLAAAETLCLRASDLTEQLLTFAKGGAPVKEAASLAELIRESADFAALGSSVRCEFAIADDLRRAEVDPGQISQVINNLIINACQAMPEGGTLRIAAENVDLDRETDLPLPAGGYVRLSVTDQGVGMPESILEKIFDPYYTTKQKGTGLGLATAYSIIKNHRGCITVDSEVGVGSTFAVYLPGLVPQAAPAPAAAVDDDSAATARVLIMDDDELIRTVLGEYLTESGMRTALAANGEEALSSYREASAEGQPFDAVVLDLTIRGGTGGAETLRQLRELDPEVKAIVASGYSNDPVLANFADYGFRARLRKPFQPRQLLDALQRVLAG